MDRSDLSLRVAEIVSRRAPAVPLLLRSQENRAEFDSRAPWYERYSAPDIYYSPAQLEDMAARHLVPGTGPILDLACGTGFMGQRFNRLGLGPITGCDLSARMLEIAANKAVYHQLVQADLHQPLPFPGASFAAAVCAGAFFAESVTPAALIHILPVLHPGGWLLCDVEHVAWLEEGFAGVFAALHEARILEELRCEEGRIFDPDWFKKIENPGCSDVAIFVAARLATNP